MSHHNTPVSDPLHEADDGLQVKRCEREHQIFLVVFYGCESKLEFHAVKAAAIAIVHRPVFVDGRLEFEQLLSTGAFRYRA